MRRAIQLGVILMVILGCVVYGVAKTDKMGAHSKLTEQDKLIACADCHKAETPEVYYEWFNSTHGLGGVKCYQCHNTFEELAVSPDIGQSCNSCHASMVNDQEHTQGAATCWECHQVHSFEAKE